MPFITPPTPIQGVPISGMIHNTHVDDTYPSHADVRGFGGFRSAATVAERDAISVERRNAGMLCFCYDTKETYQLADDLTTWLLFAGAAGGGDGWAILRLTNELQVSAINVLNYPTYQIWAESTVERYIHHSYNAMPTIQGHQGYGWAFNFLIDRPNIVDSDNQTQHIATYSELTKICSFDFPVPTTGVVCLDWKTT